MKTYGSTESSVEDMRQEVWRVKSVAHYPAFVRSALVLLAGIAIITIMALSGTTTPNSYKGTRLLAEADAEEYVVSQIQGDVSARVENCISMYYTNGEDKILDRPAHLRAASSMQWITPTRLAVLQDDLNFIGLLDINITPDNHVHVRRAFSLALPAFRDGSRQFQKDRGNKKHTLDFS